MIKVDIQNFQSIKDIQINIEGLTVINGVSNIGKSAIVRSIQYLLSSQSGHYFITSGQKQCEVELSFDNNKIKWISTKKTSKYIINGKKYESASNKIPNELVDLGFKLIEVDGKKYNIQISDQFDPIFLLKETGSKIAEVLSVVGNIDFLNKASKICSKDLNEQKKSLRIRKADKKDIDAKISFYEGFDDIKSQFSKISIDDLLKKQQYLDKIKKLNYQIIKVNQKVNIFNKFDFAISNFDLIDSFKKLKNLIQIKKNIQFYNHRLDLYEKSNFNVFKFDIDIERVKRLMRLAIQIKDLQNSISKNEKQIHNLKSNLKDVQLEIKNKFSNNCPLCGSESFNPGDV